MRTQDRAAARRVRHGSGAGLTLASIAVAGVVAALGGMAVAEEPAKAAPKVSAQESVSAVSSAASSLLRPVANPSKSGEVAGEIFGFPVSMNNYGFAKRVVYTYPQPWGGADLPAEKREAMVWESLILHYQSFRVGITATDDEVDKMVNELLTSQKQSFTRKGDPEKYRQWVKDALQADVALLENQVQFLIQIKKLKDRVMDEQHPAVTEDEMRQEFLNEKNHVGGEMVVFDTQAEAQARYEQVKDPAKWDAMKAEGTQQVRPVSLMTLEAYIDLWSIPKEQMYAFHALDIGAVGPPMPFGRQWCVYRLLEKRTGDLNDFPKERESYRKQLEQRKRWEGMKAWIEQTKEAAKLKVFVPAD